MGATLDLGRVAQRCEDRDGIDVLVGVVLAAEDLDLAIDGEFGSMPVYFGVGRNDDWVSLERVTATAEAFTAAGASVTVNEFDDAEHVIRAAEIEQMAAVVMAIDRRR